MNPQLLTEAVSDDQNRRQEVKALAAKIKGMNGYLTSLLQKKVRIDIEIRRTKTRLTKLKNRSQTLVKTSVQLENSLNLMAKKTLIEALSGEKTLPDTTLSDVEAVLTEAEHLLQEVEGLPLVEDR